MNLSAEEATNSLKLISIRKMLPACRSSELALSVPMLLPGDSEALSLTVSEFAIAPVPANVPLLTVYGPAGEWEPLSRTVPLLMFVAPV